MKKLIFLIIAVLIAGVVMAQNKNVYKKPAAFREGLKIGATIVSDTANKTGSYLILADSITGDNANNPTNFKIWRKGVQLNPDIPAGSYFNSDTVYSKRDIVDTVHLTTGKALKLTDRGMFLYVYASSKVLIRVPADTAYNFPIGSTITVRQASTGLVCLSKGTNVQVEAELDSLCLAHKGGAATLVKIAPNKWWWFGSLLN